MESIISSLQWREATKKFDVNKKLTEQQLEYLLDAVRLTPSSYGLQAWRFIVVTDPELRAKLRSVSWNQEQVTDASHLIVFAAQMPDDKIVDAYMNDIAQTRNVSMESLQGFSQMIKNKITSMTEKERLEWAQKQVYIALGVMLTAAAEARIDSCPMEGFDPQKYDEILGLYDQNLHSTVILPVGFRSEGEIREFSEKVRFPKEILVLKK